MVADGVGAVLASADPLMLHLQDALIASAPRLNLQNLPSEDPTLSSLGAELAAVVRGHEGVIYASMSFPDGGFLGAHADRDGVMRYDVIRNVLDPSSGRRRRQRLRHRVTGLYKLALESDEETTYDPRERPFFALSLAQPGMVWSNPYVFWEDQATGITRTLAVYQHKTLLAVLTVDFNLASLSSFVGRLQRDANILSMLHTDDGLLLALPESVRPTMAPSRERPVRYDDVKSPEIRTFFSTPPAAREVLHVPRAQGEEKVMALSAKVPGLGDMQWYVTALVPESVHAQIVQAHETRSRLALSVALGGSVLLGVLVAVALHRAQRVANAALERASAAAARAAKAEGIAKKLGSYELVRCLGVGGMGEVWQASHRLLPRDAAIKVIRPEVLQGQDAEQVQLRFRREARSLAQLRSRNTVSVLDYGVARDGSLFLVMELLEGLDTSNLVKSFGPLPPERAVFLMMQVCRSLAEAHALGLVHRDLKPANIFVSKLADEVDVVKVLDFGLVHDARAPSAEPQVRALSRSEADLDARAGLREALSTEITQRNAQTVGTPGYMAPEQILGGDISPATDIYALGCVMVFWLTGKRLFEGDGASSILAAHVLEPVPEFERDVPMPKAMAALIHACLEAEPDKRPRDGGALLAQLAGIEAALPLRWTATQSALAWQDVEAKLERERAERQSSPPQLLSIADLDEPTQDAR